MGTTLKKKEEVNKPVRASKKTASKTPIKRGKSTKSKSDEVKKSVARRPIKKKLLKETSSETLPETVFVPSTASLRLLEKVQIYTLWYQKHFPDYMATAAKVGGYAFITIGALLSTFAYVTDKGFFVGQPAALVCSDAVCSEVADSALPETAPQVAFLNSVPARADKDVDFSIALTNTKDVTVSVKALTTGEEISLAPIEQKESELKFLIPVKNLKPGLYTLHAETKDESKAYIFTGPTFIKPVSEAEELQPLETPTETLVADVMTELSEETDKAEIQAEEEVAEDSEVTEVSESQPEPEEEGPEVESETVSPAQTAPINISLLYERGSAYVRVVTGSFTPNSVEIYSTPNGSDLPIFLGQATPVQSEWILSLDALELPAIEHLIYASFITTDKTYQTEGVEYQPKNAESEQSFLTADVSILVQKIELALLASEITNDNRKAYYSHLTNQAENLFGTVAEDQYADSAISTVVDEVLNEEMTALNDILLRYAVAIQGGSTYVTNLASVTLDEHSKKLASIVAAELADKTAVPTIHTILSQRYTVLKDAVKNTEEQIKQDTNNLTSRDSDGDGISDFDEVALFATNPASADSDKDSVLDGVEIVTGSNALESALSIHKNTFSVVENVTFDEVVKLSAVSPVTYQAAQGASEATYMTIEGTTVPYSYVYLYSPSMRTTGVIRANSAGAFTYTLEMNIPNGKHEVSALAISAAGTVIASSRPFIFEKTDTTFLTAAAINSVQDIVPESKGKTITLYLLVAAVGVITFGFILLMLAATLRTRTHKEKMLSAI